MQKSPCIYLFILQIPNPLFDLAGITCGHFLVPFWTFFGATLIGKAIIKMHIQVIISSYPLPNDDEPTKRHPNRFPLLIPRWIPGSSYWSCRFWLVACGGAQPCHSEVGGSGQVFPVPVGNCVPVLVSSCSFISFFLPSFLHLFLSLFALWNCLFRTFTKQNQCSHVGRCISFSHA